MIVRSEETNESQKKKKRKSISVDHPDPIRTHVPYMYVYIYILYVYVNKSVPIHDNIVCSVIDYTGKNRLTYTNDVWCYRRIKKNK